MHWGISYLREDLQDVRRDMRDFRKEVAQEFANVRAEFAHQFAEHRRESALQLRHNLMITTGIVGIFSALIIAFIQYKLPGG